MSEVAELVNTPPQLPPPYHRDASPGTVSGGGEGAEPPLSSNQSSKSRSLQIAPPKVQTPYGEWPTADVAFPCEPKWRAVIPTCSHERVRKVAAGCHVLRCPG